VYAQRPGKCGVTILSPVEKIEAPSGLRCRECNCEPSPVEQFSIDFALREYGIVRLEFWLCGSCYAAATVATSYSYEKRFAASARL